MIIRPERPQDHLAIAELTTRAFAPMPYSDGTEAAVISRLRAAGALTLSLVAEEADRIIGHVAFSPMDGEGWFALGPVAVEPQRQRKGIGSALVRNGLGRLRERQAKGCALVGNPAYYGRFGFEPAPRFASPREPRDYFMLLRFKGDWPDGPLEFNPAFYG